MKILKKVLLIILSILLVALICIFVYIEINIPKLPSNTNKIIETTLNKELRELSGEPGFAKNGGSKIWYEVITPRDSIKGTIVLIMGISNDALAWPLYFINSLVNFGYRVIRFDNRGTGLSDWTPEWSKETAYSLDDMADDAIAIMDTLQIDTAHIVGASLGGMIAQTLCINHPNRAATLTSIMSTGDIMDKELPSINQSTILDLILSQIKYGLINSEENQIKLRIVAQLVLMGDTKYDLDIEDITNSSLYNLRRRNGYNPDASKQQMYATMLSGSRYEDLKKLTTPTLVIHGTTDPLIDIKHGEKCYKIIPNAKSFWIKGMGHDIPLIYTDTIVARIVEHIKNN